LVENDLADAVAAAYEAATGGGSWFEFGAVLCRLVGAVVVSLRLLDGTWNNLLQPMAQAESAYLTYYHRIDPYRAHTGAEVPDGPVLNRARLADEILPIAELHRTEYFCDFARPNGQHHMMGALLGLATPTPLGLHRDATAGPFTETERQTLNALLPHLLRALQLRNRMDADLSAQVMRAAALDALSPCVIVVDGAMQVLHANAAAATLTAGSRSGLRMVGSGASGIRLMARHRDDSRMLKRLVAATAAGGAGGAMRVRAQEDDVPDIASLAVLVSPAPTQLATMREDQRPGLANGFALVVARELAQPLRAQPARLSDLYGLTHAEAAVAVSLAGGVTAEDVARSRHVSLDTVRTQVRTVLRKTNAANLRDFERILALVAAS
jgi:DNA-binding NarL/FixJ family response regulator